ncbi:hypothetical protein P7K49_014926, partial [Saguinus oedipus]
MGTRRANLVEVSGSSHVAAITKQPPEAPLRACTSGWVHAGIRQSPALVELLSRGMGG